MNWKIASLSQLYVIAFDDPMARIDDQLAAREEILRRQRERHRPENDKIKVVYPS